MTCKEFIDLIADCLADELDQRSRSDFDRHFERCRSCQVYLDSYRTTVLLSRFAADDARQDVPEELVRTILYRCGILS